MNSTTATSIADKMTDQLTYRLFEMGDLEGVLRLWAEESGWGAITEEQFNRWYHTPFGQCLISVAANEKGEILGQQIFMPSKFYLEGQEMKACRVLAPILSKEIRTNIRRKNHPFYEMHRVALQTAILEKFSLIYGFPLHSWITVLQLFPKAGLPEMETAEYECWSLPKAKFESFSPSSNEVETFQTSDFSPDFDQLWETAKAGFPIKCSMVRDAERLRWKLGDHLVFATRNKAGNLIGYVAINKKTGLIVDMLTISSDKLETVLASTLKALKRFEIENGDLAFGSLGLMKTEPFSSLIDNFGFQKTDFKFAFGCYSINGTPTESILPGNWFMMPDD